MYWIWTAFASPSALDWDFEIDLINNSWVGNLMNIRAYSDGLDAFCKRWDVLNVCALDNGNGAFGSSPANAYNCLAVGSSKGNHPKGGTRVDLSERPRPHVVGGASETSYGTAQGSNLAIKLQLKYWFPFGQRALLQKAMIIAGATGQGWDEKYGWGRMSERATLNQTAYRFFEPDQFEPIPKSRRIVACWFADELGEPENLLVLENGPLNEIPIIGRKYALAWIAD